MRLHGLSPIHLLVGLICALWSATAQPCTSIMVGRKASNDGSVMTSHTCDSHRDSSALAVIPRIMHETGEEIVLTRHEDDNSPPMKRYRSVVTGNIPQVPETYGYIAGVYGIMNEYQVAIGEATFTGRKELQSQRGIITCKALSRLILERATTAREAIQLGGKLVEEHGWCDSGETLTISDPEEVWVMEIIGPGQDKIGAVWAARRVPDEHISVVANGSRIGTLDLADANNYMASKNVFRIAEERGYWDSKSGKPFRFYEAYDPDSRTEIAITRREWRILDLIAPSLKLRPNSDVFPFSVKPDKPVTPERIMELFRDTFEGTEFDMVKDLTVINSKGVAVKSPLANPFMPYDMNKMLKIKGGWGWRGERCMARSYCLYATILQSRSWLPNPLGGIVWFGYGNPAMTTYVPIFAGVTDLPDDFKIDGRTTGFGKRSAWWAFNRVATLAAHRWGSMRHDVALIRDALQKKYFEDVLTIESESAELLTPYMTMLKVFLTERTLQHCQETTDAYWNLGDQLWSKYNELW